MKAARLERLRRQRQQLEQRIKRAEAAEKAIARKKETRQKILLGALLKEWMDREPDVARRVQQELPRFLTRAVDRQAFGLSQETPDPVRTP